MWSIPMTSGMRFLVGLRWRPITARLAIPKLPLPRMRYPSVTIVKILVERTLTAHERRTPQIERALFVVPGALTHFIGYDLELGGDLDQIVLRILHHEE